MRRFPEAIKMSRDVNMTAMAISADQYGNGRDRDVEMADQYDWPRCEM